VFTVGSPQGRFADTFLNTPYTMWLGDLAYDHGAGDRVPRVSIMGCERVTKSDVAQAMAEHGLRRGGGGIGCLRRRRIAMTDAAANALLGYYREKIELIGKVAALVNSGGALHSYRRSFVRGHTNACERLLSSLETAASAVIA
jgi:hypothetical protein